MKQVIAKATNLVALRKLCSPRPLEESEVDLFFVETAEGRNPAQDTRQLLRQTLEETDDARILFYGHRGCGKSTELNMLQRELGGAYLKVKFSVEDQMSMTAVCAEDLILIICEQVLDSALDAGYKVDEAVLQGVYDYFDQVTRTQSTSRDAKIGVKAEVKASVSVLLLKLLAKLSSEIQFNAHSQLTTVAQLRNRPSDLLFQANQLIEAVRRALPPGKKLLIVVEDLDKLDIARARTIFVENVNLLIGLNTNIIYTIPIYLFHSPDAGAFKERFDETYCLPMIKILDPENPKSLPLGVDMIKNLVRERMDKKAHLIEDEALDYLVKQTGGVLRHVFQVIHTATCIKNATAPLTKKHIRYGLDQQKLVLERQIALPYETLPGAPEDVAMLYKRLAEYAAKQLSGQKNASWSDATNQILLQSCVLVEYNGAGWFGVHPLIIESLENRGLLK